MAEDLGHTVDISLTHDEWDDVVRRLTVRACALLPIDGALRGLGDGPADLVNETIRRLLDPGTGVKWRAEFGKPTTQAVARFLGKVLENHFYDRLKTGAYKRTAPDPLPQDEAEEGLSIGSVLTRTPSFEDRSVTRMYAEQLYARVRDLAEAADDMEVVFYLDLQFQNGGSYKNAEAASELGLKVTDIVNLRKRLVRLVVGAHEGGRQNAGRGRK
ncbi:MAG: hypothetical protein WEB59_07130 [Thermoanaerobaculia bacterium]